MVSGTSDLANSMCQRGLCSEELVAISVKCMVDAFTWSDPF